MTLRMTLLSASAILVLSATAKADCAADLAALQSGAAAGQVSKDGSMAPMQGAAAGTTGKTAADAAQGKQARSGTASGGTTTNFDANTQTAADGTTKPATGSGKVVQDGTTAPLAAEAGQPSTGVANSEQDAMAEQSAGSSAGAETTASVSGAATNPAMTAALDKATAAQKSGDEAACLAALGEARKLAN